MKTWKAAIPFGFIVAGLIALAAVPVLMDRWVADHNDEIDHITHPARILVTAAESHLAYEVSLTRGFLLTGDPEFIDLYREVQRDHRAVLEELRPLIQRLGPGVQAPFADVQRLIRQRDEATATFLRGEVSVEEFARQLPARQDVFEQAMDALQRLELAVVANEQQHRDRIAILRSRGFWITSGLVVLALLASLVILLIGRRNLRLLEEVQEQRLKLARQAETRSRLIRGIGHDVKNPLGAADGYAQLLEDGIRGELTPGQKQYVIRIRRMHRFILDIINNLLEFARAESGELTVVLSETDVDEVVRDTAEDYRGAAERAGLRFSVRTCNELPPIKTDPLRVRAIFGNLLSNAVKYTPSGGQVEVRTTTRSGEAAPGPGSWVTVEVADTGPGIPADASEYIFEEYSRLDPQAAEGAGIGLAISRTTARLLGGDLTVQSTIDEGTTFILWLPDRAKQPNPSVETPDGGPTISR